MTGPPPSGDVSPDPWVRTRLMAEVRREPVPARGAGVRRRARFAAAAAGALAVGSLAAARPSLAGRPAASVAALVAAWVAVGAAATWASSTRGGSMLGRPVGWRLAVAAGTPLVLTATWAVVSLVWPAPPEEVPAAAHAVCFAMTLGLSVGPLFALFAVHGSTETVRPGLTAASLAAAAGAWGAVGIALHCGVAAPAHVLLGHLLPAALLAAAGVAAGRVVAVRARNG